MDIQILESQKMDTQIATLDNGLQIITDKIPTSDLISIKIFVKAGVIDETPENNGISHMLEHMMFRGTTTRDGETIDIEKDEIDEWNNAYTNCDMTCYTMEVLKDDFATALDLLSDSIQNSNFPEEAFQKEKSVVIQEIKGRNEIPYLVTKELMMQKAFEEQSLGMSIGGIESNIESMTREDLIKYRDTLYSANNMIISISGNIEHQEAQLEAETLFGKMPRKEEKTIIGPIYTGGTLAQTRDSKQNQIL